jgi:glycosyltransferase involved in cell wall biosynthesis
MNRLAVLLNISGAGGVESQMYRLVQKFVELGVDVDFLIVLRNGQSLPSFDHPRLRVLDLGVRSTRLALPSLVRYLRTEQPRTLLVCKDRATRVAVLARRLAGTSTKIVGQLNTYLSAALSRKTPLVRWFRLAPMPFIYAHVDQVIAVAEGVAEDTLKITGLPPERVMVIRNPVVSQRLYDMSREPIAHPWFNDNGPPIILGAGRLTPQKDFATLIRAFAQVRAHKDCRLVILGEGRLRSELEKLAQDLNIAEAVAFPGFANNPYAYMARASLFVLSSAWEGSPNVLTEAVALGTPVVATDCPSGPRELLQDGRYGPLVPVGDVNKLAEAMLETLQHPLPPETIREAATEYTVDNSARRYLEVLGF